MFDDFRTEGRPRQARARLSGSIAAAVVLYGGASAAIVAATATVRNAVEEEMVQVEFALPPMPEPPRPPAPPPPPVEAAPPPPSAPRPKLKRPALAAPDKVPQEKPDESDEPLAEAVETGPIDGFLDGAANGTGTVAVAPAPPPPPSPPRPSPPPAPPAAPQPLVAPIPSGGNADPEYSASARRRRIEGVVVVSFEVLENGTTANARIVSGPPELHDAVLKAVAAWRFTPARRGSEKVRFKITRPIRFRLEDA